MKKKIGSFVQNGLSRYYGINGFNRFDRFLINIFISLKRGAQTEYGLTEPQKFKPQISIADDLHWVYDIRKLIWKTMPKWIEFIPRPIPTVSRLGSLGYSSNNQN